MHAPRTRDEGAENAQAHGVGKGLEKVRSRLEFLILSHIDILAEPYEFRSGGPAPSGEPSCRREDKEGA